MKIVEKSIFDSNLEIYKHYSQGTNQPIVIFCHGIASTNENFNCLLPYLGDYVFYQFTLPGHNDLPYNKNEITIKNFAKKICEWIVASDFQNIILIGHSMGGAIITKVANLLDKKIIKGLILISPYNIKCINLKSPLIINLFWNVGFLQKYLIKYQKQNKNTWVDLNLENQAKNFINFIQKHKQQIRLLLKDMAKVTTLNNSTKDYKKITCPTYLLLAEKDVIVPSKQTEKFLKKIILNLKTITFKKATHILPIEQPEQFMNKINEIIIELNK